MGVLVILNRVDTLCVVVCFCSFELKRKNKTCRMNPDDIAVSHSGRFELQPTCRNPCDKIVENWTALSAAFSSFRFLPLRFYLGHFSEL